MGYAILPQLSRILEADDGCARGPYVCSLQAKWVLLSAQGGQLLPYARICCADTTRVHDPHHWQRSDCQNAHVKTCEFNSSSSISVSLLSAPLLTRSAFIGIKSTPILHPKTVPSEPQSSSIITYHD